MQVSKKYNMYKCLSVSPSLRVFSIEQVKFLTVMQHSSHSQLKLINLNSFNLSLRSGYFV